MHFKFFQAALANAQDMSWFMQWGLYETITALDSRPFLTQTAGELLFYGYDDTLLSMADMFASSADRPMDKFAWFYKVDVGFFHQLSQIILYCH